MWKKKSLVSFRSLISYRYNRKKVESQCGAKQTILNFQKKKKNAKKYTVQLFSFSKNSCSKIKFQQQHLIIGSNAVQTKLRMPLNVFFFNISSYIKNFIATETLLKTDLMNTYY